MPYYQYSDGLYLVKQKSKGKVKGIIDHYGIVDIGNQLNHPKVDGQQPIVIHQTPPRISFDWLQKTGTWEMVGKISNTDKAINRIYQALKYPKYDLFANNCEHFVTYVADGKKQSQQLRAVTIIAGLAVLAFAPWDK